jgi:predicted Zn-dependent protease
MRRFKLIAAFLMGLALVLATNLPVASISSSSVVRESPSDSAQVPQSDRSYPVALNIGKLFTFYQGLQESDSLIQQGNIQQAARIQKQLKEDFPRPDAALAPITDAENLSYDGQKYYELAQTGMESGLESKTFEPLKLLTSNYPDFLPGHLMLAQAYRDYEKPEKALETLERATDFYPQSTEILDAKLKVLEEDNEYLKASIAARKFTITFPNHPEVDKYNSIADEYFTAWKRDIQGLVVGNQIVSSIFGSSSTSGQDLAAIVAMGEAKYGEALAKKYKEALPMVEDEEVLNYVDSVGQKVAKEIGRQYDSVGNKIEYEFYVIDTPQTNAFALPGGKIFIYSGLLEILNSEAELAGLLSHEAAHSALSHGIEQTVEFTTLRNITQAIPLGDLFASLAKAEYDRGQERDADILGTRALSRADYAADGLHRVMKTFKKLGSSGPAFLASHPASETRMKYLRDLIQRRNYNRYNYEGVETYWQEKDTLQENLSVSLANLDPEEVEDDSGGGFFNMIGEAFSDAFKEAFSSGGEEEEEEEIVVPSNISDNLIQLANLQQAATLAQQKPEEASEESESQPARQTEDTESQASEDSSNTSSESATADESESETVDATAGTNPTVEGDALVSESQASNATTATSNSESESPTSEQQMANSQGNTASNVQQIPFDNFWQEKQGVAVQLLRANIQPWGRYTLDIKVENNSEKKFGIGPFAVDILTYEREEIPSDFKVKEGNAVVEPGDTLIATVKVIGKKWQTNEGEKEQAENRQELVLSIKESTPGGRLFRIGF